jgi:hypothetical protein
MQTKRIGRRGRPSKKARGTSTTKRRVTSTKLAVSFEGGLAVQVQRAARSHSAGNVSAWLAEAARERLRRQALADAITAYEAEGGVITEEELATVRKQWPRG